MPQLLGLPLPLQRRQVCLDLRAGQAWEPQPCAKAEMYCQRPPRRCTGPRHSYEPQHLHQRGVGQDCMGGAQI